MFSITRILISLRAGTLSLDPTSDVLMLNKMGLSPRLIHVLEPLSADSPVSRSQLIECLCVMAEPFANMTREEFQEVAIAVDDLWGAVWQYRGELDTLADIQLAAGVAINFVVACNKQKYFRQWDANFLAHFLLYCMVEVNDAILADGLLHGLHTLMSRSPVTGPKTGINFDVFVNRTAEALHITSIISLFLGILNSTETVGVKLYAAMGVAIPYFTSTSLLNYITVGDVLDALDGAIKRPYEEKHGSLKTRAMILHSHCDFILIALERKHYREALLSGRYDIFMPLADGLELYSSLDQEDKDPVDMIYGTYMSLLAVLELLLTKREVITSHGLPEPSNEFLATMRESAHSRMTRLLKAVRDTPTSSLNSVEGVEACGKTLWCIVNLALGIGVHPFCAHRCCKYHFRHLPRGAVFRKCGGCMGARYCSTECQKADRKNHKKLCGKNLKAA